jgi:hypothetical protein
MAAECSNAFSALPRSDRNSVRDWAGGLMRNAAVRHLNRIDYPPLGVIVRLKEWLEAPWGLNHRGLQ